jgi:predicted Rossmann fold nucleotide-binding protein DprA/Smf involved in DNA uptake
VADGQICLVTPYKPTAAFSVGNAMGRNKVIYGLAGRTIVVAADHEGGGTWAGAVETLKNHYGRIASWTGRGSGAGNSALVKQGADELSDIAHLDELLHESVVATPIENESLGDQLTLRF